MSDALDALDNAEHLRYISIRDAVVRRASLTWERTANLRDADVEVLIPKLLNIIGSGDRSISSGARTNALRQLSMLGYDLPSFESDDLLSALQTISPDRVRQPIIAVYDQIAKGKSFAEARAVGLRRLQKIVRNHLAETRLAAAQAVYTRGGVKVFKRIPRGAKTCNLCMDAADHTYFRSDLKPIHDDCDCGVRAARRSELDAG